MSAGFSILAFLLCGLGRDWTRQTDSQSRCARGKRGTATRERVGRSSFERVDRLIAHERAFRERDESCQAGWLSSMAQKREN